MSPLETTLHFSIALVLISTGGASLCRWADLIATRTGLGSTWIGLTLLAAITSLPELSTGLSAILLTQTTDIAVGAILGSCVFNLAILALLDLLLPRQSLYELLDDSHIRSAAFGLLMMAVVALPITVRGFVTELSIAHIGITTPMVVVIYFLGIRPVYRSEAERDPAADQRMAEASRISTTALAVRFAASAVVVIGAGLWLPFVGERMADHMGLGQTFVGTIFIAFTTSAPEIAVCVAAVRIGNPNMAVSNVLGSNLFNILILAPEDLVYRSGPLLAAVSPLHALSLLAAIAMTAAVIVAILTRRERSQSARVAGASWIIALLYLVNTYAIYRLQVPGS